MERERVNLGRHRLRHKNNHHYMEREKKRERLNKGRHENTGYEKLFEFFRNLKHLMAALEFRNHLSELNFRSAYQSRYTRRRRE